MQASRSTKVLDEDQLQPATPSELSQAWEDLVSGRARISGSYSSRSRHFIELVVPNAGVAKRIPSARELSLLTQSFEGLPRKVVADEINRSISSVSSTVCRLLSTFGLPCSCRYAPILPMIMYREQLLMRRASDTLRCPPRSASAARVISVVRPDLALRGQLTSAEHDVLQKLVDGMTYAEVASGRARAHRTICNQVANIYRKLGISGRGALLAWLVDHGTSVEQVAGSVG
jgi:DNA-binding NarL/FixJ family response regulator